MQNGTRLSIWQTVLLFFVTAGVTLSNGVKIFIYALFTNGKKFFRIKYLLLAVLLPSALIWVLHDGNTALSYCLKKRHATKHG